MQKMESEVTGYTFTCISCHVAFPDGETQKAHYKTDWHRFNLKRKIAELPPVKVEEFNRRVMVERAATNLLSQDQSVYCDVCRKSFTNQNAFANHCNSKKHRENEKYIEPITKTTTVEDTTVAEEDDDEDMEEVDSDEWEDDIDNPIENNDCLFCTHHSRNLLKNINHMSNEHSFFIPDLEFCVDIKGLLLYLGDKINSGFMCIWCNEKGRTFHSAEAAKSHMVDKGHTRMLHEGIALAEYAPFYDYSSSYPDCEDNEVNVDAEVTVPEIDDTDYQIVLPSGAVIGHRSLMRYYRQNIDPNRPVAVAKNSKKLHKVLASYRGLGWTDTDQKAIAKRARDIHHLKRMQSKYNMQLGCKANKLQTHFRMQVNF